jgi:hypothetical protein
MALDLGRPTACEAARRTENPVNAISHNRTVRTGFNTPTDPRGSRSTPHRLPPSRQRDVAKSFTA